VLDQHIKEVDIHFCQQ